MFSDLVAKQGGLLVSSKQKWLLASGGSSPRKQGYVPTGLQAGELAF
ncbi:hypothetical protein K227x_53840 [Rubripirellula lacrimiformis]|uniref:Uncharacterized protein n=1 Tax=Rubripirellula lacrimiformis TaxID=1930273 RepID=A0A517NIJ4_9BACT|nr:hypothetical protein [Rubripirellula lacrimiformis]QDT06960.1 hypothetical protein K227x_53840 [Rubripirellula lacrimiformis]